MTFHRSTDGAIAHLLIAHSLIVDIPIPLKQIWTSLSVDIVLLIVSYED